MKMYNKNGFTHNAQQLGGSSDVYIAAFSGTMPTSEAEFPFDITDPIAIIENSIAVCRADDVTYDYGVLRYNFTGVSRGARGYTASPDYPGMFRVIPSMSVDEPMKIAGMALADYMSASNATPVTEITTNKAVIGAGWFEFTFHEAIQLEKISFLAHTDGRYRPTSLIIEKFESDAWVEHETVPFLTLVTSSLRTAYDLTTPLTTDKIRIRYSNEPVSGIVPFGMEFYTSVEPTTNVASEDISWFMMVPRILGRAFTSYNALGSRTATFWGTAGGPNEAQDAAFGLDTSVPGEDLKLLNLKVKALPVGDLK